MLAALISVPSVAARLSAARTRWRRRAESACRPCRIAVARSLCSAAGALLVMRWPPDRRRARSPGCWACRGMRRGGGLAPDPVAVPVETHRGHRVHGGAAAVFPDPVVGPGHVQIPVIK